MIRSLGSLFNQAVWDSADLVVSSATKCTLSAENMESYAAKIEVLFGELQSLQELKKWLEQMNVASVLSGAGPIDCSYNEDMTFADLLFKKNTASELFQGKLECFGTLMALLFQRKRSILFRLFLQHEMEDESRGRKQMELPVLEATVLKVLDSISQFLGQVTHQSIEQVETINAPP